ncbi:NAD(P)H-dependent oxidoreductase [Granulicoccus phenolivorans]|uniref:NAD(P)H-dependent oxidoreductase n=1 Tax=Granulicoccus phenolivorans TaxID=266854 RepID=UPI0004788450|nr:NAD(P)H-dependent oxidoreductase [Granulicoccus phenolivorans]
MGTLLVIHHSPTRSMQELTRAALAGTRDPELTELGRVDVRDLPALAFARGEADHRDLLAADAYLLLTPANFGYMSGALKHVFDSTFLQIGGALAPDGSAADGAAGTAGRAYGLLVHGRYDPEGAVRSVESIVGALRWKAVSPAVRVMGDIDGAARAAAYELGGTLAALLL